MTPIFDFDAEVKRYEALKFNIYDELKSRPKDFCTENRMLYPGKFYVFKYVTDTKKLFDLHPIVLSLGPSDTNPRSFHCLNLKYMPKPVRLKVLGYIFKIYSREISQSVDKFPLSTESVKQPPIFTCNYEAVNALLKDLGWRQALHKYLATGIVECYDINYTMVPGLALDDTNTFINGTIVEAQTPKK